MNCNFSEVCFKSSDGIHTVYAELYTPKNSEIKGVVQLAHGMIDYVGRYTELAEYLCEAGYVFAGNHHLGHGKTAKSPEEFGYFAKEGGVTLLLRDMHTLNRFLRDSFPGKPLVLLGHSMGSFLARLYVNRYPHSIKGVIIHGTAGTNPLLPIGKALARLVRSSKGEWHRSKLIDSLAFGSYNKRCKREEGEYAWLSRDNERICNKGSDPYASFKFTVSGFLDLFEMIGECNSKEWYSAYPKALPTMLMDGDADPVGSYGKGPKEVYKKLLIAGAGRVTHRSFEGARHELFNETCRAEVYECITDWLGEVCKQGFTVGAK